MKAQEARRLADSIQTGSTDYEKVVRRIQAAAESGKSMVEFDKSLPSDIENTLRGDGYTISRYSDAREFWYKVLW